MSDSFSTNDPRWLKLRKLVLAEEGKCKYCPLAAIDVHHIVDRKDRPDLTYVRGNLEALCRSCHSTITGKREAERRRQLKASVRCRTI